VNYVLISICNVPEYIKYTINTILSVDSDAVVYLVTDQNIDYKNVKIINLNNIESEQTKYLKELNIYKDTIFDNNPLWLSSLLRIFYLRDLQKELGLTNLVHFDNDVLIYKPFKDYNVCFEESKFNITPAFKTRLVFGFSYISNLEIFDTICTNLQNIINLGDKSNWEFNSNTPPNEMDLLGMVYSKDNNLFNLIPTLPYNSNILFDPSSYGQYIDGTHVHPKKFYSRKSINFNDIIGVELYSKRINSKFVNNKPYVFWEKKSFELCNLHIHSKRFEKFLPKNYKSLI